MEKTSVLQLEWKRREGGLGKTQREYLDFVIDDQPLAEMIAGDLVSCVGWFAPDENVKAINRLLLKEPADLPDNRRSLYVCGECGEIDCGAITAVIESSGDKIIWRDFGLESNTEGVTPIEGTEGLHFVFDREQYEQAFSR